MGAEAQEQRHVYACKICGKACVSGRSLGGHMRVHLAAFEASKIKAAIAEIEMACSGGGRDFSNTDDSERGDDDRTGSYGLRENPKKSWRVSDSDPKHGLDISTTEAVCKECGKEFPTSRALWGHMRWHSVRNKNKNGPHHCEECGKGFDSIQAMFGHMNSHSKKRTRGPADFDVVDDDDDDDNGSSAFENLFPIRRKRSMIRYSIATPHPSSSSLNECNSSGAVFEVGDVKEVAEILIMLSKGMCEFDDGVDSGFVAEDGTKSGCANELDKDFLVSNVANGEFGSDREADNLGILKKAHECPVCFKAFPSGQALGGHKRAHYGKVGFGLGAGSKNREAMMIMPGPEDDVNQELGGGVEVADGDGDDADADALFDLNFPVRISDGGANRVDVGLGLWAAEIGREVLTS